MSNLQRLPCDSSVCLSTATTRTSSTTLRSRTSLSYSCGQFQLQVPPAALRSRSRSRSWSYCSQLQRNYGTNQRFPLHGSGQAQSQINLTCPRLAPPYRGSTNFHSSLCCWTMSITMEKWVILQGLDIFISSSLQVDQTSLRGGS